MNWLSRQVKVANSNGVHARVASEIARLVDAAEAKLQIVTETRQVDCSSVLDVLSEAIVYNSELELRACGPDARQLLRQVTALLQEPEEERP
jgi:phosphocarrier protein